MARGYRFPIYKPSAFMSPARVAETYRELARNYLREARFLERAIATEQDRQGVKSSPGIRSWAREANQWRSRARRALDRARHYTLDVQERPREEIVSERQAQWLAREAGRRLPAVGERIPVTLPDGSRADLTRAPVRGGARPKRSWNWIVVRRRVARDRGGRRLRWR